MDSESYIVSWYQPDEQKVKTIVYRKHAVDHHIQTGDWIIISDVEIYDSKQEQVHSPKHDVVNNPKHYQLVDGFEVKDLMKLLLNRIEESDVGFTHFQSSCYKEAMQYFLRFMLKNGQEDIQKGVYYMNEVLKEWQESPE